MCVNCECVFALMCLYFLYTFQLNCYRRQLQKKKKSVLVLIQRSQIEQNYVNKRFYDGGFFFYSRIFLLALLFWLQIIKPILYSCSCAVLWCDAIIIFSSSSFYFVVLVLVDFFCCCWNMFELNYYNAFFSFYCCVVVIQVLATVVVCLLCWNLRLNVVRCPLNIRTIILKRKKKNWETGHLKNVYYLALCVWLSLLAPEIMWIDFWWLIFFSFFFLLFSFRRSLAQCYMVLHLPFQSHQSMNVLLS